MFANTERMLLNITVTCILDKNIIVFVQSNDCTDSRQLYQIATINHGMRRAEDFHSLRASFTLEINFEMYVN